MLEQIRSLIVDALAQREDAVARVTELVDAVDESGRADLTPEEIAEFDEARSAVLAIDETLTTLRAQEAEIMDQQNIEAAEAETRSEVAHADVRVTAEPTTYRAGGEHSFFRDAVMAQTAGDRGAAERLARNAAEVSELRAGTSADFGGLVPPTYLVSAFAEVARAGRPFAEAVTNEVLPPVGMSIVVPRGTTGLSAGAQQTELTTLTVGTYVESDLTIPVRTIGGVTTVSRQSLDRAAASIDAILMRDLANAYAANLDSQIINGDGTAGTHTGVISAAASTVAFTGTTGASFLSAIHKALGTVNAARYLPADLIVMHPRRWAWLCAQSDSSNRPLVQIDGPGFNAQGNGYAAAYGVVGSVAGVKVITDANVTTTAGSSTNEDRVIVTRAADALLWESGSPISLEIPQTKANQLGVELVLANYSAFTAQRYASASAVLVGTGLSAVL